MTPEQLTEIFKHYKPPFRALDENVILDGGGMLSLTVFSRIRVRNRKELQLHFAEWVADTLNEAYQDTKLLDNIQDAIWDQWRKDFGELDVEQPMNSYTVVGFVQAAIKSLTDEKDKRST